MIDSCCDWTGGWLSEYRGAAAWLQLRRSQLTSEAQDGLIFIRLEDVESVRKLRLKCPKGKHKDGLCHWKRLLTLLSDPEHFDPSRFSVPHGNGEDRK